MNGRREGKGKIVFGNGSSYEGEVKDNNPEGLGVFTNVDGKSLKGTFSKGKLLLEINESE